MEILDILSNFGFNGILIVLFWILFKETLDETKENRSLYQQTVSDFNKTVLAFNLTIKEISNEVKNTNDRIDDIQLNLDIIQKDNQEIKNKIDGLKHD